MTVAHDAVENPGTEPLTGSVACLVEDDSR
jgi:hypothetical protein